MKKIKLLWTVLVLALVAVLAVGLVPASAAPDELVKILRFEYHPSAFTVEPRDTVGVVNYDGRRHGIPHSLTAKDGSFDTGVFVRGTQSFRAPADPGIYPFFCIVHPEMEGVLRVSR